MRDIFDHERLSPAVSGLLPSMNPWWEGKPAKPQPPFHRWAFSITKKKLDSDLAPIVVIRGPRQVGKTTLQMQLIEHYIKDRGIDPSRILRVQFDDLPSLRELADPILSIGRWFESRVLKRTFNQAATDGQPAFLFFDEIQNIADWAIQLKSLVDTHRVKVLVTGSSALRMTAGKDSLAGRIAQVDLGTLLLREIAGIRYGETIEPHLPHNGLDPLLLPDFWRSLQQYGLKNREIRDRAFSAFSARGGYPIAHVREETPWPEIAEQLNENVVKRAIQHDLRIGERGKRRNQGLLEEVFLLASRYVGQSPGQAVFVQEVRSALRASVSWDKIRNYLKFLDSALLLKLIEPLELRLKKKKGNYKLCICDHGLRASWLREVVPLDPVALQRLSHLSDLAGHIAESVVGYFLAGLPNMSINHFPERDIEPEIDFILTVGAHRIPVEVKYRQRIDPHRDTLGLRAFLEKTVYNAPFGILVTLDDTIEIPDARIIPISLRSLLLLR
ncbi:ATP-binding protein [Candidatus Peregrinibacteria bacterium]|nr:ATP-binding protein [Candidatus Peregrinibacteria bacterium]MBI3816847.1 ATP-binding protein [Candidatus Peregrinibacteria bacterium]